jgi:hypothetical protein
MAAHKAKLIALAAAVLGLILLYRLLRVPTDGNSVVFEWHFWLALAAGVAFIAYAFSIRCSVPICARRQVFRGFSIFDLRWPGERCYHCGGPLKPSSSEPHAP